MADPRRLAAVRRLLAQLGVTIADLQTTEHDSLELPTVAQYLPQVVAAAGPGARRTYGNSWAQMAALWGDRPLDTISATDIEGRNATPSPRQYHGATAAAAGTQANT
jgi:hypothetical protein